MLVKGMPIAEFVAIVERVSRDTYVGNLRLVYQPEPLNRAGTRFRVALRADSSRAPGARRTRAGRRSVAACWHTFRDVYAEVFRLYPNAEIRTSMAAYIGVSGFEANYPATGRVNIGSMVEPCTMPSLCDCQDDQRHLPALSRPVPRPVPRPAPTVAETLARIDSGLNWHDAYEFRASDLDECVSVR